MESGKIILSPDKWCNPNLKGFWDNYTLNHTRYRVLYGGRASSKSHELATMIILLSILKPLTILCTRAFQNRIKDSVKALLEQKIDLLGVRPYFDITNTNIKVKHNGSVFMFYGLSRNTDDIKSIEGVDICYIEEGQFITEKMFDILAPTIRKQGSEVWISFNPQLRTDFIYQKFITNKPKNATIELINYNRNPYLSDTMKEEIELYKNEPTFSHVYLGECNDDDDLAIISYSNLLKCVGVTELMGIISKKERGGKIGFDVGDGGTDPNAYCLINDFSVDELYEFALKRDMIEIASKRVWEFAKTNKCKSIIYDSIGVGAGVGGFIRIMNSKAYKVNPTAFIASAKPLNPNTKYKILGTATKIKNSEYFLNLKAQQWIYFRDKVNYTAQLVERNDIEGLFKNKDKIVSFNPNMKLLDKLLVELSTPHLVQKEEGKIQVEPKEKLRDRGIPSHNLADCVIMGVSKVRSGW